MDESITPNNTVRCTIDTCPLSESAYGYAPQLAPNVVLLVLFVLSTIGFIVVGIWKKTWGFFVAMGLGGLRMFSIVLNTLAQLDTNQSGNIIVEVVGYIGRVGGSSDPFNGLGGQSFMIQICCLTIAPACYAAGIYLCLARMYGSLPFKIGRLLKMRY